MYDKKWYKANRSYRLEQMREYNEINKESLKQKRKIRYEYNKDHILKKQSDYYHNVYKIKYPERVKESSKKNHRQMKITVLSHYSSGVPYCKCCGDKHIEMLTIDHINGGGNQHRKQIGFGWAFYNWLKKNNYPPGYRVLCMNCNWVRRFNHECPHSPDYVEVMINKRYNYRRKLRLDVLRHYSKGRPHCDCCGERHMEFLTVDHINGGGNLHRKNVGYGWSLYSWLRKNSYPPDYRVLCINCNFAFRFEDGCPHKSILDVDEPIYKIKL